MRPRGLRLQIPDALPESPAFERLTPNPNNPEEVADFEASKEEHAEGLRLNNAADEKKRNAKVVAEIIAKAKVIAEQGKDQRMLSERSEGNNDGGMKYDAGGKQKVGKGAVKIREILERIKKKKEAQPVVEERLEQEASTWREEGLKVLAERRSEEVAGYMNYKADLFDANPIAVGKSKRTSDVSQNQIVIEPIPMTDKEREAFVRRWEGTVGSLRDKLAKESEEGAKIDVLKMKWNKTHWELESCHERWKVFGPKHFGCYNSLERRRERRGKYVMLKPDNTLEEVSKASLQLGGSKKTKSVYQLQESKKRKVQNELDIDINGATMKAGKRQRKPTKKMRGDF